MNQTEPQPARVPLDVDVECRGEDLGGPVTYRAVNVGEGGLFVLSTRPLAVGSRLQCSFSLPDGHRMEVETEVAWTRSGPAHQVPPPGMGLTFTGIAVDDLDHLQLYVDSFEEVADDVGAGEEDVIDLVAATPAVQVGADMMPPPPPKPVVPASHPAGLDGPSSMVADEPSPSSPEPLEPPQEADFLHMELSSLHDEDPMVETQNGEETEDVHFGDGAGRDAVTKAESEPAGFVPEVVEGMASAGRVEPEESDVPIEAGVAGGVSMSPGDKVSVILEPLVVEARVVGLPEEGIEIVGGWSEASVRVRLDSGVELTRLGLIELTGLGEGTVRMRLDSSDVHLRRLEAGVPAGREILSEDEPPAPAVEAPSPLMDQPLPPDPAEISGQVLETQGAEISLSGLEQAPLVPSPALEAEPVDESAAQAGRLSRVRSLVRSRAAITVLSCLVLVFLGAGLAALLSGGKKKVSKRRNKAGVSQSTRANEEGNDEGAVGLSTKAPAPGLPKAGDSKAAGLPAAPSGSDAAGGDQGRSGVERRAVSQSAPSRAARKPDAASRPHGKGALVAAARQGRPGSNGSRPMSKVGLAVRRRGKTVSVLLGVTGTPKKLSSYWLAKPPGVVVDMEGVRARVRVGSHKVADPQVRFVKVVRRSGGVRFIVYLTTKDAAAAARVRSAPGLGVVSWPRASVGHGKAAKISMR